MPDYLLLRGKSGLSYCYFVIDLRVPILEVPANYLFAQRVAGGGFVPLYFGETGNARDRLTPRHEHWAAAAAMRGYLFGHPTRGGVLVRCAEEKDLIDEWQPVLNTQHRQTS